MENINVEKEENKTLPTNQKEFNYKKYQTTQNFQYKHMIDYSKRILTKNMASITKFYSRDRMFLEVSNSPKIKNVLKLVKNKNKGKKEETVEKEKVINQLILTKKDMDKINTDLKEYKDFYHKLQESNMTFKVIIEKILRIKNLDNDDDSFEYRLLSDKKTDKKLDPFKRQIINYEKSIEKQEKILAETKREKKTNDFYELNQLLKEKNYELENSIEQNKKLQIKKHKKEEDINYYYNTILDLIEENNKMNESIKTYENNINNYENEIYNLENEKEQLIKKLSTLIEESINVELVNEKKKDLSKIFSERYERMQDTKREKEKYENDLDNILNKMDNMKKTIEKNKNKINLLNYDNEEMENDIYIMQAENYKLKEKLKLDQKYKSNLKNYIKEKKSMEENSKNKSKTEELKEDENTNTFFLTIPKNTIKRQDNNLSQELEKLQKELEEKKKEKDTKEKELQKLKVEYESLKNTNTQNNS